MHPRVQSKFSVQRAEPAKAVAYAMDHNIASRINAEAFGHPFLLFRRVTMCGCLNPSR